MTLQSLNHAKREEKLNKVIDKVLNQMLGQEVTQLIYDHLENNRFILRGQISENFDSFNCALRDYLGSGAVVVEQVILKNLELAMFEENTGLDFSERLKILKLA